MFVPYLFEVKPRSVQLFLQERQTTSMGHCGRGGVEVLVRRNDEGGRYNFWIPVDNSTLGFFLRPLLGQVVKKRFIRGSGESSI